MPELELKAFVEGGRLAAAEHSAGEGGAAPMARSPGPPPSVP